MPIRRHRLGAALCSLLLVVVFCVTPLRPAQAAGLYELPTDLSLTARSALLVSLGGTTQDDVFLYEKDADAQVSPAALVRLMVGLTAVQIIRDEGLDQDRVTGTYTRELDGLITGTGLTTAGMQWGEEWTLRDLLGATMTHTAADAAVTLAATLAGSHTAFVQKMNDLAAQIGCENTAFANVHGDDNLGQYTTARDLYRIMRYAMDFPEWETLMTATQVTCTPVSGQTARTLVTSNDMRRSTTQAYYAAMAFGRTGFTSDAGRCLASVARDSGYEYLCIVLGCPEQDANGGTGAHYVDTRALYQWAFNNFSLKTLLSRNDPGVQMPIRLAWNKETVRLVPARDVAMVVANGLDPDTIIRKETLYEEVVDAPITKDQVYGKLELYIQTDQKIAEVDLVAYESVERSDLLMVWSEITAFLRSPVFFIVLGLLGALLIGYIILTIVHNRRRRRKRMKSVRRFR